MGHFNSSSVSVVSQRNRVSTNIVGKLCRILGNSAVFVAMSKANLHSWYLKEFREGCPSFTKSGVITDRPYWLARKRCTTVLMYADLILNWCYFRASFELEPGALGQTTDFKEANKRLEWGLKKAKFLIPLMALLRNSVVN